MKYAVKKLYEDDNKKLSGIVVDSITTGITVADYYSTYVNRKNKNFLQKVLEYFLGNDYIDEENLTDIAVHPLKVISLCAPIDYVFKLDLKHFESTMYIIENNKENDFLLTPFEKDLIEAFSREEIILHDNIYKVLDKTKTAAGRVVTKEHSYSIGEMVKLSENQSIKQ